MMRRFSRYIRNNDNNVATPSTISVSPLVEQSNRMKTPTSPQERKETNLLESNWKSPKKSPHSPLTTTVSSSTTDQTNFSGVKKVVSNRKHLFQSHVKQKKIKMDKREQSLKNNSHNPVISTSACTQLESSRRSESLDSLEQWTDFHSKQGLYSYFYLEESSENKRNGQFEMKEPPKIIARKTICN